MSRTVDHHGLDEFPDVRAPKRRLGVDPPSAPAATRAKVRYDAPPRSAFSHFERSRIDRW
jgi:hypothetical protein